jgi:hypothetical protein
LLDATQCFLVATQPGRGLKERLSSLEIHKEIVMSKWRFWGSILAVWVVMMVTDWVFHGVWLAPLYHQTAQFWRPEAEMHSTMPWMWFGQLLFSWAFVWIYSKGISQDNQWTQAFRYALAILMVGKVPNWFVMWATVPYPSELVARWLLICFVQAFCAAFVMTWTLKPLQWWKEQHAQS